MFSELTIFCDMQMEKINRTTFERMTGFDFWHLHLGHTPNEEMKLMIGHTIELEARGGEIQQSSEMPFLYDKKNLE
jgi:hypothetical protein